MRNVYKVAVDVTRVDLEKKEIVIDEYETIKAKKIIIATGTTPNLTGAPGEKELKGKEFPIVQPVMQNIMMIKK